MDRRKHSIGRRKMTEFGNFLRDWRYKLGLSLRAVAGDQFSPQTLSNYETGQSLPKEEVLPKLASLYQAPLDKVSATYFVSVSQALSGPLPSEPFFDLLKSVQKGDHLITITQTSIFTEEPRLARDKLLGILNAGANFTYVAYLPSSKTSGSDTGWPNNHAAAAEIIQRELGINSSPKKKGRGQVNYLFIGRPDDEDFRYLRGFGACNFLCRAEDDETYDSGMWLEVKSADGTRAWTSCDYGVLSETREWLVQRCGVELPSSQFNEKAVAERKERDVRMLSLDQFLAFSR